MGLESVEEWGAVPKRMEMMRVVVVMMSYFVVVMVVYSGEMMMMRIVVGARCHLVGTRTRRQGL